MPGQQAPKIAGPYLVVGETKGLLTREMGRRHATPHMPVETARLLKI